MKALPKAATVKVIEGGESAVPASECRQMIVGPGVNQPDPFPGYDGFVGWASPCRLKNGTMFMTFNAGYWHASCSTPLKMKQSSIDEAVRLGMKLGIEAPMGGRAMITRSTDNGKTWSKPETLADTPEDDRHPNLVELPDGTIVGTFFTYPGDDFDKYPGMAGKTMVIRSTDGGKTWEKPFRPKSPFIGEGTDGPMIVLKDGSLLLVSYGVPHFGVPEQQLIMRSTDSGKSWKVQSIIKSDHEMSESGVAQLPSGRLVLITRPEGDICWSDDNGKTWTEPVKCGIRMFEPSLMTLKDGTLLCTYGSYGPDNWGVRAMFSTDGGETWITSTPTNGFAIDPSVYGYAKGIELPDGSVFLTYINNIGCSVDDIKKEAIWSIRMKIRKDHSGIDLLPASGLKSR